MLYNQKLLNGTIDYFLTMLAESFFDSFGGKSGGNFIITRKNLKHILNIHYLDKETIETLTRRCFDEGIIMVDLDEQFVFMVKSRLEKYRKMPLHICDKFIDSFPFSDKEDKPLMDQLGTGEEFAENEASGNILDYMVNNKDKIKISNNHEDK